MITRNSSGAALSADFITAMEQPMVGFAMKLFVNGTELQTTIKSASLELGAGVASDDYSDLVLGEVYTSTFKADLYEGAPSIGDEVEVRVGVEVGNSYEYVTVAWVTVTTAKEWQGLTSVQAVGRVASKFNTPAGLTTGVLTASNLAAALTTATGVTVTLGGFVSTDQNVDVTDTMTAKQALQALALRLGGYAAEDPDGGVTVSPYTPVGVYVIPTDFMTKAPELSQELYTFTGLEITTAEGALSYGDGRIKISDASATAATGAITWGNLSTQQGYTPGTIYTAIIDPRVTPFDWVSATVEDNTYLVPARGISITYDGGYFGNYTAAGLTATAEETQPVGPISQGIRVAQDAASEAQAIAEAVNQHFWYDVNGAHVTEVTRSEFILNPTGYNQLSTSIGILLRDGLTYLSQFSQSGTAIYDGLGNEAENIVAKYWANGAQIGADGSSHLHIDDTGITGYNGDGADLFDIDLDGASVSFWTTVGQRIKGAASTEVDSIEEMSLSSAASLSYIYDDDVSVSVYTSGQSIDTSVPLVLSGFDRYTVVVSGLSYNFHVPGELLSISDMESDTSASYTAQFTLVGGATLTYALNVSYYAETRQLQFGMSVSGPTGIVLHTLTNIEVRQYLTSPAPSFSLGTRASNSAGVGGFSTTLGEGLQASERGAVAIGRYNGWSSGYLFMVGNGTGEDNQSTALTVGMSGAVANYDSATSTTAAYESHYSDIDSTEAQGTTHYKRLLVSRDKNDIANTLLETRYDTSGAVTTNLYSSLEVNGTPVYRGLQLVTQPNGDGDAYLQGNRLVIGQGGASSSLQFRTKNYSGSFIHAYDNGTAYGHNMLIQSGALLIMGGGEYPANRYALSDLQGQDIEATYLGSDNQVYIETAGNSIANRKTFTFGNGGDLWMPKDGRVWVDSSVIDISATSQNSRVTTSGLTLRDKNDNVIGNVYAEQLANGATGFLLSARRGGTYNAVSLRVANDGSREVWVDDPAAWRKGLGLSYAPGDTYTVPSATGQIACAGMITSGNTAVYFFIPLSKPIDATSCTISGNIAVRTPQGYIYPTTSATSTYYFAVNTSGITQNVQLAPNGVFVTLTTSGWVTNSSGTAAQANRNLTVALMGGFKITFA